MHKTTKTGDEVNQALKGRRQVLKAVGGSAALVSVSGLAACGGGDEPPAPQPAAAPDPAPGTEPQAARPAQTATPEPVEAEMPETAEDATQAADAAEPAASGELTTLSQTDPQAQALAYVEDASSIDASEQPRYESGQACSNCTLFMGEDGDQQGPCSIFPGKLVSAQGWCSVYAPKA